jgi:ribose transport system permease protein
MDPLNQPLAFMKDILRPKKKMGASTRHRRFEWINRQELIVFILLLAAIVFFSLSTNTFLTTNNLQNVSRNFAWITIPAFGESLVIIVGGIDLSVGAVMALSGLITALGLRFGLPIPLALVLGLLSGSAVGWINGTLVGRVRFPPFIVTLGTASIVRGIIFGLAEGWPIRDLPSDFRFLGQADVHVGPLAIPVPLLITILLAVLVYVILRKLCLAVTFFPLEIMNRP